MVVAALADSLDANARGLATCRRIGLADYLPLPRLVDEPIADPEFHRQDPSRRRPCGRGLILGSGPSHTQPAQYSPRGGSSETPLCHIGIWRC
jgi:hypothetical protein